jgi:hypothetical protein
MFRLLRGHLSLTVVLCLILAQGCYTYRLQAPGQYGVATKGEVVWSLAWGLIQEQPRIDNCNNQAIAEVTVRSNLAFEIITVATLGFASPKKIEWKCAPPQPSEGVIVTDTTRVQ